MEIINLTASLAAARESAKEVTGSRSKDAFDPALAGMRALAPPGKEPPPIPPKSAASGEEGAKVEPNAPTQIPDFSPEDGQTLKAEWRGSPETGSRPQAKTPSPQSDEAAAFQMVAQLGMIQVPVAADQSFVTSVRVDEAAAVEVDAAAAAKAGPESFVPDPASSERSFAAKEPPKPAPATDPNPGFVVDPTGERPRSRGEAKPPPAPTPVPVELERQDVAREPRQDVARGPRQDVERPVKAESGLETTQEGAKGPRQDVAREPSQDVARRPRQDVAKEVGKDSHIPISKPAEPTAPAKDPAEVAKVEVEVDRTPITLKDLSVTAPKPMPKEELAADQVAKEPLVQEVERSQAAAAGSDGRFGPNGERRDHWDRPDSPLIDADVKHMDPVSKPAEAIPGVGTTGHRQSDLLIDADRKLELSFKQSEAVLNQVADRIETLMASRANRKVTIHLDPRDFGSITLVVRHSGREVDAEVYASNETVRHALDSGQKILQNGLEQKGIQLGSMTVGGELPQGSGRQEQAMRDAASHQRQFLPPPPREATRHSLEATGAFYAHTAKGIDLWI